MNFAFSWQNIRNKLHFLFLATEKILVLRVSSAKNSRNARAGLFSRCIDGIDPRMKSTRVSMEVSNDR